MDNFQVGDTVELKSGSPVMTIARVSAGNDGSHYAFCHWFTGTKQEQASFPLTSLKPEEKYEGGPIRIARRR